MRLKRILLPVLVLAGAAFLALPIVQAQGNFGLDTAAGSAGLQRMNLLVTIGRLIRTVLSYLGVLFLILMLYAGFLYMTARGDDKKITSAKGIIQGAVIGLIIIATSYILTSFVIGAIVGTTDPQGGQEDTIGTKQLGEACTSGSDCAAPNICDIGGSNTCIATN